MMYLRQSVPRELANSDVVGRGTGMHQSQKKLASRGLANLITVSERRGFAIAEYFSTEGA